MKSSIIPKEQASRYNIEKVGFEHLVTDKDLIDELLNRAEIISEDERKKIRQALDEYFLSRNEMKEKQKKFVELFVEEVQKSRKVSRSEKFLDFLIFKNISGTIRRSSGSVISPEEKDSVEKIFQTASGSENPRFIRNEKGEIVAIEVDCHCGETIRIDFEIVE